MSWDARTQALEGSKTRVSKRSVGRRDRHAPVHHTERVSLENPQDALDSQELRKRRAQKQTAQPKTSMGMTLLKEGAKIGIIVGASMVFGPVGGAIASGVTSAADQWLTHGRIRIGQTLLDTVLGFIPGGVGSAAAKAATHCFKSLAGQGLKQFIIKGVVAGAADGGVLGFLGGFLHTAYDQYAEKKPWNFNAMVQAGMTGAVAGVALGGAMGGVAHGVIHKTGIKPVEPNSLARQEIPKMDIITATSGRKMEAHRLGVERFRVMTGGVRALKTSEQGQAFIHAMEQNQVNIETVLERTLHPKNAKGSGSFGTFMEIPEKGFEQFGLKIFDADTPYARSFMDTVAIHHKMGPMGGMMRNMFTFGDKAAGRISRTQGLIKGPLKVEPLMTRLNGVNHVSQEAALITNEAGDVVAVVMKKVPGKSLMSGFANLKDYNTELRPFLKRVADMPQEAFDDLVGTVAQLEKRGIGVDFQHPGNLLVDDAAGAARRFSLVDIAEDTLLGMGHQAPSQRNLLQILLGRPSMMEPSQLLTILKEANNPEAKQLAQAIISKYQAAMKTHSLTLPEPKILGHRVEDGLDHLLKYANA